MLISDSVCVRACVRVIDISNISCEILNEILIYHIILAIYAVIRIISNLALYSIDGSLVVGPKGMSITEQELLYHSLFIGVNFNRRYSMLVVNYILFKYHLLVP